MRQDRWTGHSNHSGYVIVTVALLLVVLIGFSALAVDVGMLYAARTESQRAADAAALAGAFTYILELAPDNTAAKTKAESDAKAVAMHSKVMGDTISAGQATALAEPDKKRVTVTINRNESTFFAKMLGADSALVSVTAVAEAGPYATTYKCGNPWFVPNTLVSTSLPCDGCANGQVLISGGLPTAFARNFVATEQGFTLRSKGTKDDVGTQWLGTTFAVDLGGNNNSGSTYQAAISGCSDQTYICTGSYFPLTGVKEGPTKNGVEDLVGNPPTWQLEHVAQYSNGSTTRDLSPALVLAPIVDLCSIAGFCPTNSFPSGSGSQVPALTVVGFAMLFLDGTNSSLPANRQVAGAANNDVVAHLINVMPCNPAPTANDPTGSPSFSIPLRLVRP